MLSEHEAKRGFVKELRKAVKEGKEDNILYPCARDALSQEEMAELGLQCEKIKA